MSIEIMNAVWRRSQSTGRARLVLLAIADHQGEIGAWPSIATLARMVNASERSVQRDIQELVDLGELTVEVQNAPSRGQYKSNLYWVTVAGVTDSQSGVTEMSSGVTESTSGVTAVDVLTLKEPLLKPNKKHAQPAVERMSFEDDFQKFWSVYPRKVGKGAAFKAFIKALKRVELATMIEGARRYAQDPNRVPAFTAHASSWLNADRWDDELLPERPKSAEDIAAADKARREAKREADLAESRARRLETEAIQERLRLNPPKRCEHDRVAVICPVCSRVNKSTTE
jgi:hypothetical protein